MRRTEGPLIGVIGAGAAGTLTALHLAREARRRHTPVEIVLLDPAGQHVAGAAFGRPRAEHLLNVPASGMSALPEEPGHFLAWLRARDPLADPHRFAPRRVWSDYLAQTLGKEVRGSVTLRHLATTVTAVRAVAGGVRLLTTDGAPLPVDAVVVATGLPPTSSDWAPAGLSSSARYVADPWTPGALDRVTHDRRDVLLIGTGLTMVDVIVTLAHAPLGGRVLHAVSRTGNLPARHRSVVAGPVLPDVTHWGDSVASIVAGARAHVEQVRRTQGDWRPGVDGIRHRVADLWTRLDTEQRAEFMRTQAGAWNRLRHRMPPPTAALLDHLRATGRVQVAADGIADAEPLPTGGLCVQLNSGRLLEVGWVVNCTGPPSDLRRVASQLIADLLNPATRPAAVLSPLGLGFQTKHGRLLDASGDDPPIWVLGALRRGELWESTAVPEIRCQAQALAREAFDAVAATVDRPSITV